MEKVRDPGRKIREKVDLGLVSGPVLWSIVPAMKLHPSIAAAADSVEKLRPCDAWRVYEDALCAGLESLNEVKSILKEGNPAAYRSMQEYEADEMLRF